MTTARLLAATKFSLPAMPGTYVWRQRLHALLDSGEQLPLTVVVGVPGAGKSVLLRSWLLTRPEPRPVWLSCDSRDAEPATFWHAVVAALNLAWPDRWLDVIDQLAEAEPDFDDVALAIVNDLADHGEPLTLVIDDFHFAAAAAPSLLTLVERLPTGCRVIVGSRTEPQLALHRLRAHGQVLEVRDQDLRLVREEVEALLHEYEVDLSDSETTLLLSRTEGWTAGVQMAAMSLRQLPSPDRFLAELARTPRAITDFLATEVFDRQPADIHDFLLATSVLDVFDAASCAAVSGRRDAKRVLADLEERNLFLIRLDDDAYRYHPLFADLLRQQLHGEDPDRERAVHRLAATHYVECGDAESAIGHLLAAGEEDEALDLLRSTLMSAFYEGDGRAPHRLAAKVTQSARSIEPTRLPDFALALAASGPSGAAEPWIHRARRHDAELDDDARARLALAEAVVALRGGEAVDIEQAFESYDGHRGFPDDDRFGYVPSLVARGRLWLGDLAGAREIYEESLRDSDDPSSRQVVLASGLAWLACLEGGLTESAKLAHWALSSAEVLGLVRHPITAEALCAEGRIAFDRGDLRAAEDLLEQSISASEDLRPAFAALGQLLLSRLWLALGRTGEALDGAAQARSLLGPASRSPLLDLCLALESRIALAGGDPSSAEERARSLTPGTRSQLLLARIAFESGRLAVAADTLAGCFPTTLRQRLDAAVLDARIEHARKSSRAEAALSGVLALARTEGFVLLVTDDMPELRPQVAQLIRAGRVGTYEQSILDRIEQPRPTTAGGGGTSGPLSDRELTVLRYLSSRLTNREIASAMYVSTNTLKTHVARIYRKLGVSSRTEAVAEARRLGLR